MIRQACHLISNLTGWKFVSVVPEDLKSFVLIGAPHTSNHDFVRAMAVAHNLNRNTKFVIKSEWMKFPFNLFMSPIGGYGIDRAQLRSEDRQSHVEIMASLFKKFKELVLMIAPEGTRSPNDKWKTGFYYVAKAAGVPIVLGYADYEKKEAGVGKVIYPTDFDTDMAEIMKFYAGVTGKHPQNFKLDTRYA